MNTFNILLYGCGNIGYRHLEGLVKSNYRINIFIHDLNDKQIAKIKKNIISNKKINKSKNFFFTKNFYKNKIFDLVIMATTSKNRFFDLKEILKNNTIKYLIIEKVPFQSINEFKKAIKYLKNKKISTWINCPNRVYKDYINLKKYLNKNQGNLQMIVKGGSWGLASNIIHYVDIFSFILSDKKIIKVKDFKLSKIFNSKRKGFKEITGSFKFSTKNNDILEIYENNRNMLPLTIDITKNNKRLIIFESENKILYLNNNKNNRSVLPDINTSYRIYKTFFHILLKEFNKDRKYKYKELPIT